MESILILAVLAMGFRNAINLYQILEQKLGIRELEEYKYDNYKVQELRIIKSKELKILN